MKKLTTLKNDFHETQVKVLVEEEEAFFLSKYQWKRVCKNLCGVEGCLCHTLENILEITGNEEFPVLVYR